MMPLLTIIGDLEVFIGGAISQTFGQIFVPLLVILAYLGIAIYMRASFENVIVFLVPLIAILAMSGIIVIPVVIFVIIVGSVVIFFAFKKIFGV